MMSELLYPITASSPSTGSNGGAPSVKFVNPRSGRGNWVNAAVFHGRAGAAHSSIALTPSTQTGSCDAGEAQSGGATHPEASTTVGKTSTLSTKPRVEIGKTGCCPGTRMISGILAECSKSVYLAHSLSSPKCQPV